MSKHHVQAALRHVARIDEALKTMTSEKLADLDRRGRFVADPDGFPARTMSDGMPSGSSALTSVERGAEARGFGQPEPDSVGDAIRSVFDALRQMSVLADKMLHSVGYVDHVASKSEGRVSSLAGDCQACGRDVAGTQADRMRASYCQACYRAWLRDGKPERAPWEVRRMAELAASADEQTA